jgi:quinol monooxygenase YgiN
MKSSTIRLKVLPEKQAEFEVLVSQLVRDVNANEPDPKIYEVRKSQDNPLEYFYFLSFTDEAAQQSYQDANYHTTMSPKAVACLDGDPEFVEYDSFY